MAPSRPRGGARPVLGVPLNRRIVGAAFMLYGALMLVGGLAHYRGEGYRIAFEIAHAVAPAGVPATTVWGIGFVVVGLANEIPARRITLAGIAQAALVGMLVAWGLAIAFGAARADTSWGGGIWPGTIAVLILVNAKRNL